MSLESLSKHEQIALMLSTEHFTKVEGLAEGSPMTFKSVVPLPEDRSQLVFIRVNDTAYQVSSPFAQVGDFSADRALKVNPTLFGIDIVFNRYSLVATNLVEAFSIEPFMTTFGALAMAADEIERTIGGGDEL
jgi:hypothetical protein